METSIISQKLRGLVGGPLLVGGLGPGPTGPPINPALCHFDQRIIYRAVGQW